MRSSTHDIYEPVARLGPVLVNHEVDVRGATFVVTRVDGGHLRDAFRVGVPTATEPALPTAETTGRVRAVQAICVS